VVDDVFLVQELLKDYSRERCSPRSIIKIDLGKVYDSVHWDFLMQLLDELGFSVRFVN
jgi:hypothetical protein